MALVPERKLEVPAKLPRLSSPRASDDYERSRHPRSYIHGVVYSRGHRDPNVYSGGICHATRSRRTAHGGHVAFHQP
ncbi:hypothetical protein Y032_0350g3218 [Ancylostoma ceylanicum]|uniref:Uncharacterized protein n=1 Tax=Ancylostoma ceylanicum TaxID=53326 RepID=A0A016RXH7_9BILA|nr:hypothetical protein Y032_0350g3218 [Ancylostoma ceylanicum]